MTTQEAEKTRLETAFKLYDMTKEELEKFKTIAYGAVSEALDQMIDRAVSTKI